MTDPEVIIIGSGPAGTSACWPLVKKGIRVLMLDAGEPPSPPPSRPSLADLRRGGAAARRQLLGPDLRGLRDVGDVSPKLRILAGEEFGAAYHEVNRIVREGIDIVGTLAVGGLSNVWGAVSPAFDDDDLRGWPITAAALSPWYAAVADRIGISGSDGDSALQGGGFPLQLPLPLSATPALLLERYEDRKHRLDVRIGRSRNAVLSEDKDGRAACNLDGGCMWGCPRGSIYNSAYEIPALAEHEAFELCCGQVVERIGAAPAGFEIHAIDRRTRQPRVFRAPTVVLAGGTIPSTRLVLELLGRFDEDMPLATNPAMALAFCFPGRLGQSLPQTGFGLAQLALRADVKSAPADYVYGELFDGATLSVPDLIRHMPFSRPGAMAVTRGLLPGLVVGFVFFSSDFSRNAVRLERGDGRARLQVRGRHADGLETAAAKIRRRIGGDLRKLGLYYLPGSGRVYPPGAESHFAGTLPMGSVCSPSCEVVGVDNLFVVDGSVFPRLPAKPLTFTIMANASRVGAKIAERLCGR